MIVKEQVAPLTDLTNHGRSVVKKNDEDQVEKDAVDRLQGCTVKYEVNVGMAESMNLLLR